MKKIHFNLGVLLSLLSLAVGVLIFIGSLGMNYWSGYGPGEGFVSLWVSGGLIIFSLVSGWNAAKEPGVALNDVFPEGKLERMNLIVTGLGLVLFLILVERLGFLIASAILLSLIFSRGFMWKKAIPLGILLAVVCTLLFGKLLEVPLPTGLFGF